MRKISTLFVRDLKTGLVVDAVTPGCEWVIEGEGVATRKWDGTCCMVRNGVLYKRREVKPGKPAPEGFEEVDADPVTGKRYGWVPVGDGPEDKYHREAWKEPRDLFTNWTYELIGPKVEGNNDRCIVHMLVPHGRDVIDASDRSFVGLMATLKRWDIEGLVFWRELGNPACDKAKIKARDFGLKRGEDSYLPL